ncbi:putative mediator of RNA polymerase II transcription subunit 26 [Drosophila eugracilis]|uniref:putative mediator of RNA polymerase II transcription subunit 26 n=1 Tax=Drosophila eugracilis TaxID=29029 RepID=UPI001BDA55FB|nr:putative mediator of RNA polymerase II transcription subunit 26 [Drosophila eugracilis]
MIYALMWLSLAMTMEAIDAPLPLSLAEFPILPLEHGGSKHHYQETGVESLPGLTGYTRNYYHPSDTATADDLATYGNYAHNLLATHHNPHPHPLHSHASVSSLGTTANGFVPFYYNSKLHSQFSEDEEPRRDPSANIDFVINTANYEPNSAGYEEELHHREPFDSYAYRPRVQFPTSPPSHYHFEQISNYRENRQHQQQHHQEEQEHEDNSSVYGRLKELQTLAKPVKRQQEDSLSNHQQQNQDLPGRHQLLEQRQHQQIEGRQLQHQQQHFQQHLQQKHLHPQDQRQQQRLGVSQDQQLLYSHKDTQIADLPAITTSVRHTPESSKAVAGVPLSKHIEITKNVPVTHYQKQHVPYKQTVQMQVPRTVIAAIPKPMPIKIPVAKTVAVPQLQEVKIPIERVKPVPVERPIPFVVERRVPYRVEKPVVSPVYYPYPVKVPVVRTVVHKQRPQYVAPGWSATGNHLLG